MLLQQNFLKIDQLEAEKWLNMWEGKNCQIGQIGQIGSFDDKRGPLNDDSRIWSVV